MPYPIPTPDSFFNLSLAFAESMPQKRSQCNIQRSAGADEGIVDVVAGAVVSDGIQELIERGQVTFAERTRIARQLVGGFQIFEAGRAVEREIELVIVENLQHKNIVPALSQQPQAALD